jgi:pimeloyl-ACP methyl ester carboxylesterase
MHLTRRTLAHLAIVAVTSPNAPARAWCGAPFPPFAYQLPWFEFKTGTDKNVALRVVGDFAGEKAKQLQPLLILPHYGLTYEYLETLEAATISERRVAFAILPNAAHSTEALGTAAQAALEALEVPRAHVLGHGAGAAAALALYSLAPDRVASLTRASPIASYDDAEDRSVLEARPSEALLVSSTTASRACVDSELAGLKARPQQPPGAPLIDGSPLPLSAAEDAAVAVDLLRGVSTPMLVTRGSADVSSKATATRIIERVPGARLATFDGCGSLAHVEQRSAYISTLLDFLDSADGVPTRRAIMLPGSMKPGGSVRD